MRGRNSLRCSLLCSIADTKEGQQFGLIAEEVARVNPDLVAHDKNGKIYTVRYQAERDVAQ
jgi:hypothetical protein